MKTLFRLIAMISLSVLLWGCPEEKCTDGLDAVLRDLTGMDGCTWILELPDGQRLEPVNLADFDVTPEDNMPVRVTYIPAEDMMGICMVGAMVEITCIEKR